MAQESASDPKDWAIDWDIDLNGKEYILTKERYSKECPSLEHKESQTALFKILTAGRKLDKPLLLYLCDSYSRSRIKQYTNDEKLLTIPDWIENDDAIQTITNHNKQRRVLLKSAMETFYKRFNGPIRFGSAEKINDSIRPFALYVDEVLNLIKRILAQKTDSPQAVAPFQIDLWIIPKAIAKKEDEDEDEYEDDEEDEKESDDYKIDESLTTHHIPYIAEVHQEGIRRRRSMSQIYNKFKLMQHAKDAKDYPHNKRFCIIADRRTTKLNVNKATQTGDTLYIYQTPKASDVPNDHLHEKYIQNSAECVLPEYDGCDQVTAKTGSTKYFMLSFHVDAENEIRCYLYHKSQIVRFYPEDIVNVWPCFFVDNEENEKFVKAQTDAEKPDGIETFDGDFGIPDITFDNSPFREND